MRTREELREYNRLYYLNNKDKVKKTVLKWRQANKERCHEAQKRHYRKKKTENPVYYKEKSKAEYWKQPEKRRQYAKDRREKLKQEMLEAYGNKCACCGETEKAFMTMEHKARDGKAHRKAVGGSPTSVYRDLKLRGWPQDNYELLCFNCNRASWELGICPHRRKGEADNE